MDESETIHSPNWHAWTQPLVTWLNRYQPSETTILIATALIVGLGTGFGAIIFRWLIDFIHFLAFDGGRRVLGMSGSYYVLFLPAIGGLFVGPLIYLFAQEAKGHGVPEVMEAVALKGGRIRPVVAIIKSLASSICIGSGGSAGREGPIVQIGSALGSTLGQALHMSDTRIRMLVACGAAGGISATFNAPIAGVLFALEVILGEFSIGHFSTVVISSVTADVIARIFLGNARAFAVPAYYLVSPWELFLYAGLGVLAAPVGVGFTRLLYKMEDVFAAWEFPEYLKPAVGGLGVGLLGLYAPELFGVGYEVIDLALHDELPFMIMGVLLIGKLIATSLTLGSGGSGGVFAPGLFMGSMVGGLFGNVVHRVAPTITAVPGAYALVGMATVFAASARAPLTAIIILFEMTGDYRIILPLMLSTVIATLLAEQIESESIYTLKLSRRGIRLKRGQDVDVLQGVLVSEVMDTHLPTIVASASLSELRKRLIASHHHGLMVLDESDERLVGVVTLQDLERAMERSEWEHLRVRDIMTREVLSVYPDEPVGVALRRMGTRDIGRLPVVARDDPRHLLGIIRRPEISKAYQLATLRRGAVQKQAEHVRIGRLESTEYLELVVEPHSVAAGRAVCDLPLPEEVLLVTRRRGIHQQLLHGDDVLSPGDVILAFAAPACVEKVRQLFGAEERMTERQDTALPQ